jgi:cytochrome c2
MIFRKILTSCFVAALLFLSNTSMAADGENLFKSYCASCHKIEENYTGPALKGVRDRWKDPKKLVAWIINNKKVLATGDPYANKLLKEWNNSAMTVFEGSIDDAGAKSILDYIDAWKPPVEKDKVGGSGAKKEENSLLFGLLTLILAVVAFVLLQVNSSLRKLSDEKEGVHRPEPVPVYRNKTYLMIGVLSLFCLGGYLTMNGAINMGRHKDYQPEQPIYYSHKVHAGVNQINCLYCHSGAQDGKHSNIPSVNVCMNCHMAVNKYEGEAITTEEGKQINGTAEIQKLYAYAGWNPVTKKYNPDTNGDGQPDGSRPIEWVRIHNLPDHVYFNHSQHVKVGKQNCQTCHGNIQEMGEVKQHSDLSMGWCINCHRESKVDFVDSAGTSGNKYYSIYEKFHKDIKDKKIDSVTVEQIGGTECQKCHY